VRTSAADFFRSRFRSRVFRATVSASKKTRRATMATIPTGRFVWFEYVSKDDKKAQAFFGELFHWKTKDMPMPNGSKYTQIMLGNEQIGGYLPSPPGGPDHAHWLAHLQVTNAAEAANKVKSLGGRIAKEPTKMGDFGTMAVVIDPFGAPFALWQPAQPEGTGDYKGTEGSFVWNELYAPDVDKAVSFYKQIGGFEVEQMKSNGGPGPSRYDILKSDGKGRAGIMKMEGVPPMWMPYVKVANTDQIVDKAKRLGATSKHPAETIPNVGRLAVVADPLGALIGILQPAPGM
jgi:predicted enzyme related to lactoylglutathione lyase